MSKLNLGRIGVDRSVRPESDEEAWNRINVDRSVRPGSVEEAESRIRQRPIGEADRPKPEGRWKDIPTREYSLELV